MKSAGCLPGTPSGGQGMGACQTLAGLETGIVVSNLEPRCGASDGKHQTEAVGGDTSP